MSAATNNSEPRQRAAFLAGAKRLGLEIVGWFNEPAVMFDVG